MSQLENLHFVLIAVKKLKQNFQNLIQAFINLFIFQLSTTTKLNNTLKQN
jgi:hypothetical protein